MKALTVTSPNKLCRDLLNLEKSLTRIRREFVVSDYLGDSGVFRLHQSIYRVEQCVSSLLIREIKKQERAQKLKGKKRNA